MARLQLKEVFRRLGFPKHSDEVYAVLEQKGPLSASGIVRETHVHRPAAYRALNALVKAGLLTHRMKGKRTEYSAESRRRILMIFSNTKKELQRLERPPAHTPRETLGNEVRTLEGDRGITAVFDDVIEHSKRGETFYRYTSERELDEVNRYLSPGYRMRRDQKRLERLVISNPSSGREKRPRLERFVKFLGSDSEPFRQNAIQLIYGDRIALIDLNSKHCIIIENKALADFQKAIFRALYKKL